MTSKQNDGDEWIDVRDGFPEVGTECAVAYGRGKAQQATVAVVANSMAKSKKDRPYFLSSRVGVVDDATHFKVIGPLPPPPQPRGPFTSIAIPGGDAYSWKFQRIKIVYDGAWFEIDWPYVRETSVDQFVNWLNEMWAKDKRIILKHRARIKSTDSTISNRWATGYYVRVENRSFIVLDDATLTEHHLDDLLSGLIEIRMETLEAIE